MSEFRLKVVAFGIARDIIGGNDLQLEVDESTTAAQAMEQLKSMYPDFTKLASLRLAVNESYVEDTYRIQAGDELVLIPPVSGG